MSDFLITVQGPIASGKTTILRVLLEALADAGLMTTTDTKRYSQRPEGYFGENRITNTDTVEQLDITLCAESIVSLAKAG